MKIANIGKRLRQIMSYLSLAQSFRDYPSLFALGISRGHTFGGNTWLGKFGRSVYPTFHARLKTFGGAKVYLDLQDISHMVVLDEFVLERIYDVQLPFKPDAIFDCGGHIGLFSLLAAGKFPGVPIVTFEPNPRNIIWFKRNIPAKAYNIELVEAAVSIADGVEWFNAEISHGGHLGSAPTKGEPANAPHDPIPSPPSPGDGRFEVKVIDFPRFFQDRHPSRALLKIDIEGEEMRLLPALVPYLPKECALLFETHAGEPAWNTISELLTSNGFVVTKQTHWEYATTGVAVRSNS